MFFSPLAGLTLIIHIIHFVQGEENLRPLKRPRPHNKTRPLSLIVIWCITLVSTDRSGQPGLKPSSRASDPALSGPVTGGPVSVPYLGAYSLMTNHGWVEKQLGRKSSELESPTRWIATIKTISAPLRSSHPANNKEIVDGPQIRSIMS